jgi:hypothetical protein
MFFSKTEYSQSLQMGALVRDVGRYTEQELTRSRSTYRKQYVLLRFASDHTRVPCIKYTSEQLHDPSRSLETIAHHHVSPYPRYKCCPAPPQSTSLLVHVLSILN